MVRPINEAEGQERLAAEQGRHQLEWRWLRRSLWGGMLAGALSLGLLAFTSWTPDNSALLSFNRGDWTFLAAVVGLIIGPIAGFVLWSLWVNVRSLVRGSRSLARLLRRMRH